MGHRVYWANWVYWVYWVSWAEQAGGVPKALAQFGGPGAVFGLVLGLGLGDGPGVLPGLEVVGAEVVPLTHVGRMMSRAMTASARPAGSAARWRH